MCLDPVSLGVMAAGALISGAMSGISAGFQTANANKAAQQQFEYQEKQAKLNQQAAMDQYYETVSRNHLDTQRNARSAFEQSQASVIENMKRQAAAEASGSTAGLTGIALQQLTSDYQVAIGGVATNLQDTMRQLNENQFFANDNARRQTQSAINQSQPAPYLMQSAFSNGLTTGALSAGSTFASGVTGSFGTAGIAKTPKLPKTK